MVTEHLLNHFMHTWLYLMLNKKKNVGAAHLGPRGLDCVVCWKRSVCQEAVSTTIAGAKIGLSRLLGAGTLLCLTVILMMRRTPLLLFRSLSEQEITSSSLWNSLSVSSRNQIWNILSRGGSEAGWGLIHLSDYIVLFLRLLMCSLSISNSSWYRSNCFCFIAFCLFLEC